MATSLTLQNDASLAQGYVKVNGTTSATFTTTGLSTPQATIGSITGILKATSGVVSQAVAGTDYLTPGSAGTLTFGTPQTATGQTSITFTGIPSTARRISVLFHGVTNNATVIFIRIGNGSVLTSGYTSICSYGGGAGNTSSSGFNMNSSGGSNVNNAYSGAVMIYCVSGFNYAANSAFCGYISEVMNGYITTSNYIDRVNISSSSAFNSGTINISYE